MGRKCKSVSAELLYAEYITNKKTINQIALDQGVSAWKISDLLRKYGIPKRSKAESQKLSLKQGRAKHPTKGKKLTKEQKTKISQSMYESWKEDIERTKQSSERMKKVWDDMPQTDRQKKIEALKKSSIITAKEGSRTEKFFAEQLMKNGWAVETHRENLVINEKMHTDIYVPQARTVIEIDGPTHVEPIYGQERFIKTVHADNQKNGLLLSNGYCIIRVRERKSKKSDAPRREALQKVLRLLDRNKNHKLDVVDRLSYVDIE